MAAITLYKYLEEVLVPLLPWLGKPLHFSNSFYGSKSTFEICLR